MSKSSALDTSLANLLRVAELQRDWDGWGSPGTDEAVVEAARAVLRHVHRVGSVALALPAASVCPISGGTLQLEWDVSGRHLEIEFLDARRVAVLWEDTSSPGKPGATIEFPLTRLGEMRALATWLIGKETSMRVMGIDPGCSATGWAVVETKPMSIVEIGTWRGGPEKIQRQAMEYLLADEYVPGVILPTVAIQVPGRWRETWPRFYAGDKSGVGFAKHSMLAGWFCGAFKAMGWTVLPCPAKEMRRKGLKQPLAVFNADWNYSGTTTSEHARDAAYIALDGSRRI